ncbi:MAG TPA: Tim44/TimA family putative adaptor protein [Hypericibacter adhaerens]|uniref:Tim44/TimA family putative adaptor protein n=1 Tax=Hypericibacter adhaerens TaxID=2602016 RepID=UPI002B8C426C|nr:Tim44/TimA family putative adaptor protein [Hypericibacter adhaerens]HWA41982.1 Tim44/TimA family putative adaptor protein [Hypericibacter adhaerens]
MGGGFQFLDILFFGAIAVFLVFRLRSVLGKRIGHEQKDARRYADYRLNPDKAANDSKRDDDKVVALPDRSTPERTANGDRNAPAGEPETIEATPAGPLDAGLAQIRAADPDFSKESFLGGAKAAFEMIVQAYAAGDVGALRPLLSNEVFDRFKGAIDQRKKAGETLATTLVGIKSAEILEAGLQDRIATVTVKFVSEQVNVTTNAAGKVVDGDGSQVTTVTDIWSFARNTRARDPNWSLVATRSPN